MVRAYLLIIFTMILFSGNILVGKIVTDLPPFMVTFFRCFIALLFILPFSYRELKSNGPLWKKEWKTLTIMGVTGIALFNAFVYSALHHTSSTNVAIVGATTTVFTVILSILFLKEKLNKYQYTGVVLSLTGALWVITSGSIDVIRNIDFNYGDLIALGAVLCFSSYSLLVKKHNSKFPIYGGLTVMISIAVVFLIPLVIVEWLFFNVTYQVNGKVVWGLLYLGIFPAVIALILWNKAIGKIGPSRAAVFLNLLPVFTILGAVLFLGEVVSGYQLLGGILVIFGVYLSTKVSLNKVVNEDDSSVHRKANGM